MFRGLFIDAGRNNPSKLLTAYVGGESFAGRKKVHVKPRYTTSSFAQFQLNSLRSNGVAQDRGFLLRIYQHRIGVEISLESQVLFLAAESPMPIASS